MHSQSVQLYDKLYHFKNYDAHTENLVGAMRARHPGAETLLEVACGTGRFLELLARYYTVEGLDINAEMLGLARQRLPDRPLHRADMIDFRLGKNFDIVSCLFSSIAYAKTRENFLQTISTLVRHLAPDGLLVIEPFFTPDTYWVDRVTMNTLDEPELKLCWMYVSRKVGEMGCLDTHYMVGTPQGINCFTELHELGLFRPEDYHTAFEAEGLDFHFDVQGPAGRGLYLAWHPAGRTRP